MNTLDQQWYKPSNPVLLGGAIPQVRHRITKENCVFFTFAEAYQDSADTFAIIVKGQPALYRRILKLLDRTGRALPSLQPNSDEYLIAKIPLNQVRQVCALL